MKKNSGRKTKEQVTKVESAEQNLPNAESESPKPESKDNQADKDSNELKASSVTAGSEDTATAKTELSAEQSSPAGDEPSAKTEPSALKEPFAGENRSASKDSSASKVSSADKEPSAKTEQSGTKEPSAKKESGSAADVLSESAAKHTAQPTPVTPEPQAQPVAQKSSNGLAIVAIILVLLLGAGGYYFYMKLNTQLLANSDGVAQLSTSQSAEHDKTRASLSDKLTNAEQKVQQLSTQVAASDKTVTVLQDKLLDLSGRRPNDWLLAEANYLVRLAGRKLWLEKDQQTASSLLSTADLRIAEMNDPSLLSLRKALAQDIAALQALPTDQTESIALKIDGLISQVDNLKLNTIKVPEALTESDGTLSMSAADWKENIGKTWDSFIEGFITVRRRSGSVEPLMSPKQQWYLEENLKGKLIQSQLALYRQQQDAFEHAIELSTRWVMQFYDRSDSTTEFMLKEFAQLKQQKITVKYPKKFHTSDLLYIELSRRSIVAPTNQGG